MNDVGESSASINRRRDDSTWPLVESALRDGGHLYRPMAARGYYVCGIDQKDRRYHVGISATRVKRLERAGVLSLTGVDRYELSRQETTGGDDVQIV